MRVTILGARGSVATPGPATARYGGNTSTVEVTDEGTLLVLDAGTGIRGLAENIAADITRIDILLTHLHMDHIQGLGFFHPLTCPEVDVHIWGPPSGTLGLDARLARYLSPPLFPIHFRDLPSVTCHEVPPNEFVIGPFAINASLVCHPDPTLGYRIHHDGRILAYIPDHEPALCQANGVWPSSEWISGFDLAFKADLLIHDSQYREGDYADRAGYGHSSYRHAFEFASLSEVSVLVPFHHDPAHDDETLDRLHTQSVQHFTPSFRVSKGLEGAVFKL